MAKLSVDEALKRITEWLTSVYDARVVSLVLYGSAASGDHHSKYSDLNLLCVLDGIDAATLDAGAEAQRWWADRGNRPIVFLSRQELENAADVFAIEYTDIQAHHRVLAGAEVFANVPRFPELHRLQVEHDLRAKLIRLRARYMLLHKDVRAVEGLLLESATTFITLFRHALVVTGSAMISGKHEVVTAAAQKFDFSAEPFLRVLNARRDHQRLSRDKKEIFRIFAAYLDAIQRVERRLEEHT